MFNEFDKQVEKPWAVYCYSDQSKHLMIRLPKRVDGETYLQSVKRKFPKKFYLELVFDPSTKG